ncbi:MAG: chemotaxis protein CheA [Paracoccaceae bacterium]
MAGSDALRETFFQECDDLLEVLSEGIAALEETEAPGGETINAVFRAVHSIKGGAGAFGFERLVRLAHALENLLDDIRAGRASASPVLPLLFRASDRLHDLVEAERSGLSESDAPDLDMLVAELAAAVTPATGASTVTAPCEETGGGPDAFDFVPTAIPVTLDPLDTKAPASPTHRFRFAPARELYLRGNDPIPLLRALGDLGELHVDCDLALLPPLSDMQWDGSYLSWRLECASPLPTEDVLDIFEFVREDARLDTLVDAPSGQAPTPRPPEPARAAAGPDDAETATAGNGLDRKSPSGAQGPRRAIRVELDRVDRLINLVGELVISEAMLSQSLSQSGAGPDPGVIAALGQLKQLSTELQERIMAIRAQSVKTLFQRMSRIVREAAAATGRDVRLISDGEGTEVDKTVIERLADPLTHMLRNAVDHGIEPPDLRLAAGKPRQGTVLLSAAHRSGQIVIEITDDGAGIDREKVLAKAIERGIVPADADLSEQEVYNLLFEPGFSTAQKVSDLSGRGVGMDVVRTEIQALGGRVTLASVHGQGTTVTISLPLTLAVVEGMLAEVAGETLVIPSTALRETMRAGDVLTHPLGAGAPVLSMRGAMIPVVDLGEALAYRPRPEDLSSRSLLLVETLSGRRIALAVDRILGQREVVIKGLGENCGHIPGIAAATILGDGRIALIIDIDQIAGADGAAPDRHPHVLTGVN